MLNHSNVTRRFFLILSISFLVSCSYLGYGSNVNDISVDPKIEALRLEETELHPFAIMQGLTTENIADFKILAKKEASVSFKIFENENEIKSVTVDKVQAGDTGYIVYQLRVTGLQVDTNYTLQVIENEKIADQRTFNTVALNLEDSSFGVLSCLNDKYVDIQFKMWQDYLKHSPTYTFMIGDNVYADNIVGLDGIVQHFKFATPDILWKRYVQTFNIVSYYRAARLTPTLGMWDDHDYGNNGGDQSYPYKKEALKIFEAFYGFKNLPLTKSKTVVAEKIGGAGYIFRAFGQSFVFIDSRSFRSEPTKLGKDTETHLGFNQSSKIFKELNADKFVWLIKGDQFFGAYHRFESYEGIHPNDFKKFLAEVKTKKAKVFFVSGDRHLNELMKIEPESVGYETYELTSSAIHATVYPGTLKKEPNPRYFRGVDGIHNYSIVKTKTSEPGHLKVTSYGPKMKVLFEEDITIK